MSRSGEFELIAKYLAPLAGPNSFDLKDDAALLQPQQGFEWVITQDAIAETVHFFGHEAPANIAKKALRVNISDIIAKGGAPGYYSLALGIPDNWADEQFSDFAKGLAEDQAQYHLTLTGGDTYKSPDRLHVNVTMMGTVPTGQYVSRLGAQVGDKILVSGTIGNSAVHHLVKSGRVSDVPQEDAEFFRNCYELPVPPIGLETIIRKFASASMDVSDGLLGDLAKLIAASNVSAKMERSLIPLSSQLSRIIANNPDIWNCVLGGGDDYQTLFTVEASQADSCVDAAAKLGVVVTEIGEITGESETLVSLNVDGVRVSHEATSYRHF